MRRYLFLLIVCVCAAAWPNAAAPPQQPAAAPAPVASASTAPQAEITRYCATCHNEKVKTAGLALDKLDLKNVGGHAAEWEKVVKKLRTGTMPPPGAPRPEEARLTAMASWLEAELDRAAQPIQPGRPMLRRLNRAEYGNSIRDLLSLDLDVRSLLPADDSAFGFDNIGDLLTTSPALLDRYLIAADRVSAYAVGDVTMTAGSETYIPRGDQSQSQHQEGLPLGTVGGVGARHMFPLDGTYEVKLQLWRTNTDSIRGLETPHDIEITVDGERVFLGTVGGDAENGNTGSSTERADQTDARLRVRVPVKAGQHTVAATFVRKVGLGTNRLRPFLRSNAGTYDSTGRPHIRTMTVTGPFDAKGPGDTESRRRIFTCRPSSARDEDACARKVLEPITRRAYRRPVTAADMAPVMAFYKEGRAKGTFDTGVQLALRRILASPSFLFRIEEDPAKLAPGASYRISDLELASRLSFFLWSSLPDDALIDLAAAGRLSEPAVLEAQVRRMIADPRADALIQNFAGQWLHIRNLQNIAPNTDEFPDFDNDLRDAFRKETELFFGSVVREDRNILDLLNGDYTFVNERLAKHYGITNVYGSRFRRVSLQDEARRGLLGKGSVLLATSHADRTAPTLRGKWILENLLGTPPPPPPADVPGLDQTAADAPKTMRQRLEVHRANPACASCHRAMDPLGFVLENFNAVGAWRTRDAGTPVDASGATPDGTKLDGVVALQRALMKRPDVFVTTVTEKMLTYATGRGLQPTDMPVVRHIVRTASVNDYRFSSLILEIVRSAPFRMRQKAAVSASTAG
jgi:mono/diheme cytochrome c family protein